MSLIRENRTAGEAVGKGRRKKEESKSESWQTTKKGQRSTQHSRSEGAQRQLSGQCVVVEAVVGVVEVVVVVEELGAGSSSGGRWLHARDTRAGSESEADQAKWDQIRCECVVYEAKPGTGGSSR